MSREKVEIWAQVPDEVGVYAVGDRVAWCEGCYGTVVLKVGGTLGIRTDDGVDRLGSEEDAMKVEAALSARGIKWQ